MNRHKCRSSHPPFSSPPLAFAQLGGLSNKEKEKRKSMPIAAVKSQAGKRFQRAQMSRRNKKNFSGRKAWKT